MSKGLFDFDNKSQLGWHIQQGIALHVIDHLKECNKHVIYGNVPSKSNSYRIITFKGKNGKNHASIGKTSVLKRYEKDFYKQYVRKRPCIEGEFKIELKIYYPSRRADLDGCLKVILDCLQKVGAVKNDNKCVGILADRLVDKLNPRVELKLIEIFEGNLI